MADKRRIIKETVHSGSGEVHGVLSVVVDLNRFGQGLRVSAVALARHVAALRTVVVFVHQMVASSEGHQPGVVGRGRDGDGAGAADVSVAQLVGEKLQLISREAVVIP